ncbi:MAG: hypothetical protein ACSHW1_04140, partial [Yoonia sp.]|uniref:hypothetical protein n=1 Tax=Yoonia sp. TaxID=2212373 RepID=UPI003EF7B9AB
MQGISFVVAPIACHAFFEKAEFERLFRDDFLEVLCLAAQFLDLSYAAIVGCRADLFDREVMYQATMLKEMAKNPDRPIAERLQNAKAKYWHLVM